MPTRQWPLALGIAALVLAGCVVPHYAPDPQRPPSLPEADARHRCDAVVYDALLSHPSGIAAFGIAGALVGAAMGATYTPQQQAAAVNRAADRCMAAQGWQRTNPYRSPGAE